MKKMIISAMLLAMSTGVYAQMEISPQAPASEQTTAIAQTTPTAEGASEWMASFTSVVVDAPFDIKFVKVPDTQSPRIIYDTKGSTTTKFKAEVKNKVLRITERPDSRRLERTTVTLEYNEMQSLEIENATATFSSPITSVLFDMTVGGAADVTASLDVKDLKLEFTGRGTVLLTGTARYFTIYASTGKCDATGCEVMSAQVNVTSGAQVSLWVTDRLEAKTTTNGKVSYKGDPDVMRFSSKFMGGDIVQIK